MSWGMTVCHSTVSQDTPYLSCLWKPPLRAYEAACSKLSELHHSFPGWLQSETVGRYMALLEPVHCGPTKYFTFKDHTLSFTLYSWQQKSLDHKRTSGTNHFDLQAMGKEKKKKKQLQEPHGWPHPIGPQWWGSQLKRSQNDYGSWHFHSQSGQKQGPCNSKTVFWQCGNTSFSQ